jgi:hypothetical protein
LSFWRGWLTLLLTHGQRPFSICFAILDFVYHLAMQEAMENLKINGSTKTSNVNLPATKGASSSDAISCISSGDAASTVKESEMNQEASVGDQGMYYYGYYYPGGYINPMTA